MKCPNCDETLIITERQGIEIDYCHKCRGVWLDKGELDKIIERSLEQLTPGQNPSSQNYNPPSYEGGYGNHHQEGHHGRYNKHGRRGFLGNLFDF